jgi:hypothetical protein
MGNIPFQLPFNIPNSNALSLARRKQNVVIPVNIMTQTGTNNFSVNIGTSGGVVSSIEENLAAAVALPRETLSLLPWNLNDQWIAQLTADLNFTRLFQHGHSVLLTSYNPFLLQGITYYGTLSITQSNKTHTHVFTHLVPTEDSTLTIDITSQFPGLTILRGKIPFSITLQLMVAS